MKKKKILLEKNLELTKEKNKKSCPRCAKRNPLDSRVCVSCGFRFDKKSFSLLKNFLFSFCLVCILSLFLFFHKENVVEHITVFLKIGALFFLLGVIISIFTYGRKEKIQYSAEEKMIHKNLRFFKVFSRIMLLVGLVVVGIVFFYFLWKEIV